MAKKLYEVEYDDDLHMADVADDPNYKRGLLCDDGGHLKGHAKMHEVNEDELRDRYVERDQCDYDYYEHEEVELTPEQQELAQLAGEALAAMLITLIAAGTPHVQRWWVETAVPGIKGFLGGIASFFKGKGRKNQPAQAQTKQTSALQLAEASLQIDPRNIQTELDAAYEGYRKNMSSKEVQKTLVEVVILTSMLAERIKKLSNANITDEGIAGGYLGWQETVNRLTSQELINGINGILAGDTKLFNAVQIANLELILGRSLYENGRYMPIDSDEFCDRLMPGIGRALDDDSDGDSPMAVAYSKMNNFVHKACEGAVRWST